MQRSSALICRRNAGRQSLQNAWSTPPDVVTLGDTHSNQDRNCSGVQHRSISATFDEMRHRVAV